jgi:hypothetical protein
MPEALADQALAMAQDQRLRFLLFEGAGLFWLGAEMLILAAVAIGRRRMQQGPPFADPFRPAEWRVLLAVCALFLLLCTVVLSRHFLLPQAADLLQAGAADEAAALYRARLLQHLALWAIFVVGWVVLEAIIVFEGWRGYRHLRRWLGQIPATTVGRGSATIGLVLLCLAGVLFGRPAFADPLTALQQAGAEVQLYYNALYLLLRIAGAAWVAIEWVAAVILVRSLLLVRAAVEGRP